jgi:cytochrome c oxidase subunit 3
MSILSSPVFTDRSSSGGGRGGERPPLRGGGDDSRSYDGLPDYGARLRRARLGLLFALVPISALFSAFTVAFVLRHGSLKTDLGTGVQVSTWVRVELPLKLLLLSTSVLMVSSITMELARRKIARDVILSPLQSIPGIAIETTGGSPWLAATLLLGFGFLAGQWMAWRELQIRGLYLASTPGSTFFYLLTATHAVHLLGGIVMLLYAQVTSPLGKPVEMRRIVIEVTAWYWHFMALLWAYVFCLLYFAR